MTPSKGTPQELIELVDLVEDDLAIPPYEDEIQPFAGLENPSAEDVAKAPPRQCEGATCFAFMGASGGVGVTSLCVQLSYALAQDSQKHMPKTNRTKEPRICLIDLDFENGSCAHQLDLQPGMSMNDLIQSPERIDRAYVAALMSTHQSGIDLLAAPNSLGGNDEANPLTVVAMLDMVCQIYDHVILDVPRFWRPWNMAAIAGADRFALITDLTIPSLQLARQRLTDIEQKLGETMECDIILNKHERRSFRNSLREKDARIALKRDITATICVDHDTLREAINCGEPAGAIRSESRYVKDVKSLQIQWGRPAENVKKKAA